MNFYLSSLDIKKVIIRSVLAIILGGVFCAAPDLAAKTLILILGGSILFVGIVSFLSIFTFKEGRPTGINYFNLALSLLIGLALLIVPEFFINLIMILLGIILVAGGVGQIISLISVRKWGIRSNFTEYLLGVLLLALGVFICFKPAFSNETLFLLFGIGAIFYGITNLIILLRLRKELRKSGKTIVHGNIEDVDYTISQDKD